MVEAAIAILSLLTGFFLNIFSEHYRDRKKQREEGLRNHFSKLEHDTIQPICNSLRRLRTNYGTLYFSQGADSELQRRIHAATNYDYSVFQLHFPKEAQDILDIPGKISEHNKAIDSFKTQIGGDLRQKIHVSISRNPKPPVIHKQTLEYLYANICELVQRSLYSTETSISYDFNETETIYLDSLNQWLLSNKTQSETYGRFLREEEANSAKATLVQMQESRSYAEIVCKFLNEAEQLTNEAKGLLSTLEFICERYGKVGLRQLLKKNEECPYCRVIFGIEK